MEIFKEIASAEKEMYKIFSTEKSPEQMTIKKSCILKK